MRSSSTEPRPPGEARADEAAGSRGFWPRDGGAWLRLGLVVLLGAGALAVPAVGVTGAIYTDSETASFDVLPSVSAAPTPSASPSSSPSATDAASPSSSPGATDPGSTDPGSTGSARSTAPSAAAGSTDPGDPAAAAALTGPAAAPATSPFASSHAHDRHR